MNKKTFFATVGLLAAATVVFADDPKAAANKAHVENAKNDPADFKKGYNAQSGAIQKEVRSRRGKQQLQQKESAKKSDKQSQAGVFNSGADVDDDDL